MLSASVRRTSRALFATSAARVPFPYERVHVPVLLDAVVKYLEPSDNKIYLDGTFGEGGYTKRILDAADCKVVALDQDPSAVEKARMLSQLYPGRLTTFWKQFGDMQELNQMFDGIVLDIGLSSSQISSDRGFSFQQDSPLDMRMSYTATHGALGRKLPAHAVVNQFSSDRLASIFRELGQERHAKLIAREIERRRAQKPIATTAQLVEAILAAVPRRYTKELHIHPATRVFQSLRIFVNDELGQLKSALDAATAVLNPGGRLAVVSFHSLEDSIVKKYFRSLCAADISASQQDRPLQPGTADAAQGEEPSIMDRSHDEATDLHKSFQMLTKRAIKPGPEELQLNPRSRSSRLRVIERVY